MASWRTVRTGAQFINLDMLRSGKTITDKLARVVPGSFKDKPQVIAHLEKTKLAVAINTTSCQLLEDKWGEDMDDWVGKTVKITAGKARFGASTVDCVLVSPAK